MTNTDLSRPTPLADAHRRHAPAAAPTGAAYRVEAASFEAGGRTLLQPLTLELSPGRVCGLIGHNGSGKSTLLKLLARQQTPAAGAILLDGRPLAAWDSRAFARKVAYLPQQLPGADGMTVRELVALGRYPWHGALGRFGAHDREKVDEAMRLTDVARFADRAVDSLSGGERQRAWIAMLVAQDSEWLLLDEPISALDIGHQLDILRLVKQLCDARGLGVVVVLHDVNMAMRFCDDLVALRAGSLFTEGPARELTDPARLEAIYGVPMGIVRSPYDNRWISFPR